MVLTEHLPPTNGLGFNPAVDAICGLIVGSLPCSEFFFSLKNQHFHLLPFDLDHERTDTI